MAIYNNNGQYGLFNLQDTPENVSNSGYGETYYGKSRAFDQADREQALRDVEYSKRDVEGNVIEPDFAEGYGAGTDRIDYDPAFGTLNSFRRFQPAPYTGQRPFANLVDLPSNLNYLSNSPPSLERILDKNKMFNRFELNSETPQVENYPTEPQNLGFIEPATVPKEAIYQDRIMNNNLPSYGYEPKQGILQGLQDKIGSGFNNVKDFAIDKGNMGRNLIGSAGALAMGLPGMVGSGVMSLLSNLGDQADYQQYTPGFDYNGLNDSMINDFYDPATGLNRFDRARRNGNTFASSRNLAEYFKLRREKKAQDKINAAAATKAAEAAARGNYTPGGSHLSRGTSGGGLGLSQAQAQSVSQANKDAGYSSFSGLKDGGLASMFTRRR